MSKASWQKNMSLNTLTESKIQAFIEMRQGIRVNIYRSNVVNGTNVLRYLSKCKTTPKGEET